MSLLASVLLSDLQLHRHVGMSQTAKQRRNWFANLKVNRPVFDLNDDVVLDLAIERLEYVVCSSRAVALGILPIKVMVVDERPVENNAAVGFERACDSVGGVRRRPPVSGRAGLAFGICLDNKSAEVRNSTIDVVCFLTPPLDQARVQRVKRIQPSNDLGTAQIYGYGNSNARLAEYVSNASKLGPKIFFEKPGIRVDIIDCAAVNPNRSKQTCVLADASEVRADATIFKKNGASTISPFNSTIKIVPLGHPTQSGIWLLDFVPCGDILVPSYLAQKREHSVQDATISHCRNNETPKSV